MKDTSIAVMANDIKYIKKNVEDIQQKLEKNYVTLERFKIVEKIVYATASTILLAVLAALIQVVLK